MNIQELRRVIMVDKNVGESRIRRPAQYDSMLDDLKEKGVFGKLTNALVFAACLGYRRSNPKDIGAAGEPVRLSLFSDRYDEAVINSLAILAKNGDPLMLAKENEDERIAIFERYACGGLEILAREIWEPKLEWEKAIVGIILDEFEQVDSLTNLTEELSGLSNL
ncbi:MAG: DNA phosphorothioation-associated protein 4 [Nanoarchaeota archaeon]|nr:DNA phosphorothioation-associated protein 4 [Nanoarchaeota archaeon]